MVQLIKLLSGRCTGRVGKAVGMLLFTCTLPNRAVRCLFRATAMYFEPKHGEGGQKVPKRRVVRHNSGMLNGSFNIPFWTGQDAIARQFGVNRLPSPTAH